MALAFPELLDKEKLHKKRSVKVFDFRRHFEGTHFIDEPLVRGDGFMTGSDWLYIFRLFLLLIIHFSSSFLSFPSPSPSPFYFSVYSISLVRWVYYNKTSHCVSKLTGCEMGDIRYFVSFLKPVLNSSIILTVYLLVQNNTKI